MWWGEALLQRSFVFIFQCYEAISTFFYWRNFIFWNLHCPCFQPYYSYWSNNGWAVSLYAIAWVLHRNRFLQFTNSKSKSRILRMGWPELRMSESRSLRCPVWSPQTDCYHERLKGFLKGTERRREGAKKNERIWISGTFKVKILIKKGPNKTR